MKNLLFRLSRVASVITFLIILLIFFSTTKGAVTSVGFIILTLLFSLPLLIFNWLCFGKISIWINKD